ncbi:hypothetical protein L210DRAFT_3567602 [Boletus edulis BED1]|uniref:Prolyl 4-hydroxylase alpha subunit Fe(2+) 2OG dioxygenase domain-containing protein n=1 Tax=Boletus edulis BED1 TaxID=1328754 RepID=A0AAD4G7F9_BOLED|nr:hypothetical protein L210DRAFT_3567602 [Boletus edulis BED1]
MDMELYKLNIYGKGDFFKAHKDTPRSQDMFGSLVVVFPSAHEGGQLVLRHRDKEWTVDLTEKFMTKSEPSVCFIAFFGDIEHEVLPVTSGYCVTLTYNLYHKPIHPGTLFIQTPSHLQLKQALVDLVNDKSKLPNGGYLGFGLAHEYLKGSDRALADVCDALGLRYSLRLLYRGIVDQQLDLITTNELDVKHDPSVLVENSTDKFHIMRALRGLGIEQVEGGYSSGMRQSITLDRQYFLIPNLVKSERDVWTGCRR